MPPSLSRPPEYGSPEWQALDRDDPRRKEAVFFAADCWRLLTSSPHVSELLGEWVEWMHRRTMREASWVISAAEDWKALASPSHPTYAELEERRGELSRIYRCDWKCCGEDGRPHLKGGYPIILCPKHSHLGIPEELGVVPEVNVTPERLAARERRRAELAATALSPEEIRGWARASVAAVEAGIAERARVVA